jgi:hypothetical protein
LAENRKATTVTDGTVFLVHMPEGVSQ